MAPLLPARELKYQLAPTFFLHWQRDRENIVFGDTPGIHPNLLGRWKREFEGSDRDKDNAASSATLRPELNRLRKENKQLKLEREILKKAAAFFAREQE